VSQTQHLREINFRMEKDSTEVSSGQVMTMLQRMMEKMEQGKQEMNTRMDQMNTTIVNIKDEGQATGYTLWKRQ
jgi:predicted phosphoribosyltransferase